MTEMNDAGAPRAGDHDTDDIRDDRHTGAPAVPGGDTGPARSVPAAAGVPRPVPREEWFQERDRERTAAGEQRLRGQNAHPRQDARDEPSDPLASVAGEARRLLDTVQRRVGREVGKNLVKGGVAGIGEGLGQLFGGGGTARPPAGDVWAEAVAGHDDEEYICRACPVCRVKAARREAGGDVTDHLLSAGGELVAAFRQAVDALSRPAGQRSGDTETRVQHIDLG
ncbi:hypothetical protein Sme01_00800 [Sphaerisporangium melleum]|uniref:Uncharacterized protein n=1 Tax=Sphaerisporangium melleum TaxID=321316 RepID=A0A917RIJ6_9ACTN|nr:hypothetical protein [Sphaerisporangium melleum]GGL09813.1 hypothetical protein GCM10007964_60020 [Sphaerisporangium melleum]GII67604.1 hypothetical protein Sme01_00800 [Sphaerisporangium melleum]